LESFLLFFEKAYSFIKNHVGSSIIVPVVAIFTFLISIKKIHFDKKIRINDIQPFFNYINAYGGYFGDRNYRIPNLNIFLMNKGGKALIVKIDDVNGNMVFCKKLNNTINNNEELEIVINAKKKIEVAKLTYQILLYFNDIDNNKYYQIIRGISTNVEILPPQKVK